MRLRAFAAICGWVAACVLCDAIHGQVAYRDCRPPIYILSAGFEANTGVCVCVLLLLPWSWCCCLPLQEVWQLLQEFQALISSYIMKYSPPDAAEWRSVIQEVRTGLAGLTA